MTARLAGDRVDPSATRTSGDNHDGTDEPAFIKELESIEREAAEVEALQEAIMRKLGRELHGGLAGLAKA